MTGRPVNIADFRCRVMKARATYLSLRDAARSSAMKIEPLILRNVSAESPVVFDIGLAREAQRQRRRPFRAFPLESRAKVIRFGERQSRVLAAVNAPASWPIRSNSPYDFPPAA